MNEDDFIFELGRLTFLYKVESRRYDPLFILDLIEVFIGNEPLTDKEMDAINHEYVYDLACYEFKKQRL